MAKIWIIVAVVAFLIEIFTFGNLICAWFIVGAIAALILELLHVALLWQYIIFIAVSIVSMLIIRPLAANYLRGNTVPTNSDRLIGQTTVLLKDITRFEKGKVNLDGINWICISADGQSIPKDSIVKVVSIDGVKLLVRKMD